MTDLVAARQPYIDGAFRPGAGGELVVDDPATGEPIATVEAASVEQFTIAIVAARRAFDEGPWPRLPAEERIATVRRLGDALASRRTSSSRP